jgi:hypothetical protein
VVAAAAGERFSIFLECDGSLWGMGHNGYGELGTGDYTDRHVPVEIVPPAPPTITSISLSGSNVVVSWPTDQCGFSLQSATNLAPPVVWSAVSPGPVTISNQFGVTTPITGPQAFYRLGHF